MPLHFVYLNLQIAIINHIHLTLVFTDKETIGFEQVTVHKLIFWQVKRILKHC